MLKELIVYYYIEQFFQSQICRYVNCDRFWLARCRQTETRAFSVVIMIGTRWKLKRICQSREIIDIKEKLQYAMSKPPGVRYRIYPGTTV